MVNVPDGVVAQYARELGRLPLRLEGGGRPETAWLPSVSPLALVRWRASTPAGRGVSPILRCAASRCGCGVSACVRRVCA